MVKKKWKIPTILAALVLLLWSVLCFLFGFDTGSTMRDTERIQSALMKIEVLKFEKLERTARSGTGKAEEDAVEAYLLEFKGHVDALNELHEQLKNSVSGSKAAAAEGMTVLLGYSNELEWKAIQDMMEKPERRIKVYMLEQGDTYEAWYDDWSSDLKVADWGEALEKAERIYQENRRYLERLEERMREADGE